MRHEEAFWLRVQKTATCWLWTGTLINGYGRIYLTGGEFTPAHRYSFELHHGPIAPQAVIDHICRTTQCVNPDHLRAVSNRTNVLAGIGPSAINARKEACFRGHAFTPENTYPIPSGGRGCRECRRHTKSQLNARLKATRWTCEGCGVEMSAHSARRHRQRCVARAAQKEATA